jgi:ribosome biogenesis GTPase
MQKEGTVVKVYGLYYTVDDGVEQIDCYLKGKNRIDKKHKLFTNPVAVGDCVVFTLNDEHTGSIISVLERTNHFSRKDRGRNSRVDIIAANLDQVLIIQSFYKPEINLRFVDRLSVRAYHEGIKPILCVNKYDIAEDGDVEYIMNYYKNSGLEIIITSKKKPYNLDKLKEILNGKRTLLAGMSGVGKTSLINALFDGLNLRTTATSDKTGKGRHTTTNVVMYRIDGTELIDSPGVREFGMVHLDAAELHDYFYEFSTYSDQCSFSDCSHIHEPVCGVKKAVEEGKISFERYVSYSNILESILYEKENEYR